MTTWQRLTHTKHTTWRQGLQNTGEVRKERRREVEKNWKLHELEREEQWDKQRKDGKQRRENLQKHKDKDSQLKPLNSGENTTP